LVLSMRASRRVADVAAESGPFWQQIYVLRDRGVSDDVARQATAAGATALVLTLDTPFVTTKSGGFPAGMPTVGIVAALDRRDLADVRLQQAADVSEADIARLADLTGLPIIAKGVLRGDEALRCVDAGVSGVIVSTHGGRQLDGVVPVPHALAEVVEAVGDRAEIFADGGVRTGIDVVRALGLGARAVLLGRPVLWGLATNGADGVRRVLTEIIEDTAEALALAGCTSPADAERDLVWRAMAT
jgi:4-hydroxymandelate oxidase